MHIKQLLVFRKLVLLTVVLVYLVILAGAIVRGTGSGMGCPDWPKCFGTWVPPTNISDLPANYKERFKVGNHLIADFNPIKTWIEYINRLLGVVVGLSVFLTFVYSFRFFNTQLSFFLLSFLIVVLTGFQGWIGAKVVASNLSKYMITIHMLIAIVILSFSLYLFYKSGYREIQLNISIALRYSVLAIAFFTFIQILVGTQVRQEIDTLSILYNEKNRESWISGLSTVFDLHRFIAIAITILNVAIAYFFVSKIGFSSILTQLMLLITTLVLFEYLIGIILVRFDLPFLSQPFHLLIATITFGFQFYLWLLISGFSTKKQILVKA